VEDAQVEVVEPVALGDRSRELVLGDRAPFDEQVLGRRGGVAGGGDGGVRARPVGVAEPSGRSLVGTRRTTSS